MGPYHTSLQFLSGNGRIRIPLFHFTAEGREATQRLQGASLKDAWSLPGATAQPAKMAFHRCGFRLAKVKVRCVGPQNYLECSWGKG